MIENIDKAIVENILHQQIIGHLGCHAFDTTYVVPISYAYANNCIYAHSSEGMKLEMMRENPAVCFEVFRMENIANWQCVICWGKYEEITDENERAEAINILLERKIPAVASRTAQLTKDWPFAPKDLNEITGTVFRITIEKITGKGEKTEEYKSW